MATTKPYTPGRSVSQQKVYDSWRNGIANRTPQVSPSYAKKAAQGTQAALDRLKQYQTSAGAGTSVYIPKTKNTSNSSNNSKVIVRHTSPVDTNAIIQSALKNLSTKEVSPFTRKITDTTAGKTKPVTNVQEYNPGRTIQDQSTYNLNKKIVDKLRNKNAITGNAPVYTNASGTADDNTSSINLENSGINMSTALRKTIDRYKEEANNSLAKQLEDIARERAKTKVETNTSKAEARRQNDYSRVSHDDSSWENSDFLKWIPKQIAQLDSNGFVTRPDSYVPGAARDFMYKGMSDEVYNYLQNVIHDQTISDAQRQSLINQFLYGYTVDMPYNSNENFEPTRPRNILEVAPDVDRSDPNFQPYDPNGTTPGGRPGGGSGGGSSGGGGGNADGLGYSLQNPLDLTTNEAWEQLRNIYGENPTYQNIFNNLMNGFNAGMQEAENMGDREMTDLYNAQATTRANLMKALQLNRMSGLTSGANRGAQIAGDVQAAQAIAADQSATQLSAWQGIMNNLMNLASQKYNVTKDTYSNTNAIMQALSSVISSVAESSLYGDVAAYRNNNGAVAPLNYGLLPT